MPTPTYQCSLVEVTSISTQDSPCSATGHKSTLNLASASAAPWNRSSGGSGGLAYSTTTGLFPRVLNLGPDTSTAPGITQVRWWVQPSTTSACRTPPCLTRDSLAADGTTVLVSQVVATGIEDLQIVPTCDVDQNSIIGVEGSPNRTTDEWFNNASGDTVTADCLTYPLVRVSMIARTSSPDTSFVGPGRPALENHTAGAADSYHRRMLSANVRAPNVGMYVNIGSGAD